MTPASLADFAHLGGESIADVKRLTREKFPEMAEVRQQLRFSSHPDVIAWLEEHDMENIRDYAWLGGSKFYFKDTVTAVQFKLVFG